MTDFVDFHGLLWPAHDTECRAVAWEELSHLERVFPHVTDWSACVQAGGNCGLWPLTLAKRFGVCYTFEPDPKNFACLAHNCKAANIVKLQAALGSGGELPVALSGHADNCGAHQIKGDGIIPCIALDALHIRSCGLIYLDIEGAEIMALEGARDTIARFRPVIGLENKGLTKTYGHGDENGVRRYMDDLGYQRVDRFGRDELYAPS